MASRPPPTRAPTATTSQVRRNLFNHHLSRRPTSASTSTSTTTIHEPVPESSNSDIVVRNEDGKYLDTIPMTLIVDEEHGTDEDKGETETYPGRMVMASSC